MSFSNFQFNKHSRKAARLVKDSYAYCCPEAQPSGRLLEISFYVKDGSLVRQSKKRQTSLRTTHTPLHMKYLSHRTKVRPKMHLSERQNTAVFHAIEEKTAVARNHA